MPCNNKCSKIIQIGNRVKINGFHTEFTIPSFDYISYLHVSLILKDNNGHKHFMTRRKFEIKCISCPNHKT